MANQQSAVVPLILMSSILGGLFLIGRASGAPKGPPVGIADLNIQGKNYRIFRLGGGQYQVQLITDDGKIASTFTFDQNGPISSSGDPALIEQLKSDMLKFPPDLFKT